MGKGKNSGECCAVCGAASSIWIYPTYSKVMADSFNPCPSGANVTTPAGCSPETCNETLIKFSFGMITLDWIFMGFWIVLICCIVCRKIKSRRYIRNSSLEHLPKEELVELYYKYVIPLPQRKYRMNRRGREMTKKQIVIAKKRKLFQKDDSEPLAKKSHMEEQNSSRLLTSFSDPSGSVGNRLKPPPSCIDHAKKTIKLSAKTNNSPLKKSETGGSDTNNKTKDISGTVNSSGKKKIKLISFSSPSSSTSASPSPTAKSPTSKSPTKEGNIDMKKTVCLINKHLSLSNSSYKTSTDKESKVSAGQDKEENMVCFMYYLNFLIGRVTSLLGFWFLT
ncbi:hypothetical protein FSP39_020367 [Pinctada imbricata]|uniref:Uncharacterized protein n=1 Tax=Pinctada imbricata TaxID=66713 RepID=A0AA88YC46_PINIB|nr:hypothetical protein FSP39_020367 [Pinctada imbricata]